MSAPTTPIESTTSERLDRELRELVAHAKRGELLRIAADENEAAQVTAVRLEEDRLEALDLAVLLERRVLRDRLVEELDRLALTAAHGVAEADEQPGVCHSGTSL